tara:strand:+ start:328 stop:909 length:582 start_codon:yes stop_codon:yes gene_type:complete
MKKAGKFLRFGFMFLYILLASCSPEDGRDGINGIDGMDGVNGVDGVNGADGINGVDGVDGTPGSQGPAGEDGNVNIISSDWITTSFSTADFSTFDIVDSAITAESTANAAILAYGRVNNNTSIVIPFTFSSRTYYFSVITNENIIRFIGYSLDGSAQNFNDFNAVRYVIIPPETDTSSINLNDYDEVQSHFGL